MFDWCPVLCKARGQSLNTCLPARSWDGTLRIDHNLIDGKVEARTASYSSTWIGINTGHYWLGRLCQQMQSYHVWYAMNSLFYWPCVCRIYWRRKWWMFLEGFRKSIAASWRIEQKREKANEQSEDWKSIFMWLQMQEVALERGKCGGEWTGKSGAPVAPRQQGGGDPNRVPGKVRTRDFIPKSGTINSM